jgi:cyclin-C
MLGNCFTLHQRVIATATVFFRQFHVENLYCETDPFIMIAACCYVAAKAEEFPVHIKNVVSDSCVMFGRICVS